MRPRPPVLGYPLPLQSRAHAPRIHAQTRVHRADEASPPASCTRRRLPSGSAGHAPGHVRATSRTSRRLRGSPRARAKRSRSRPAVCWSEGFDELQVCGLPSLTAAGAVGGPLQLGADHGRESRDRVTRRLVSDPVGRPGTRHASRDRRRGANDLRQTLLDNGEGRARTGVPPESRTRRRCRHRRAARNRPRMVHSARHAPRRDPRPTAGLDWHLALRAPQGRDPSHRLGPHAHPAPVVTRVARRSPRERDRSASPATFPRDSRWPRSPAC